jgi:hypothetical protein
MKNAVILSQGYSARIEAVEALLQVADATTPDPEHLRVTANRLDESSALYGRASTAVTYGALADALRIAAMLVEWRSAILEAKVDADRFFRAAVERQKSWLLEYGSVELLLPLSGAMGLPSTIGDVAGFCKRIAATPLPIGVFAQEPGRLRIPDVGAKEDPDKETPVELAVAFLRFAIDGVPAAETHFLTPQEAHDLDVEVRVSRWPENAQRLELAPVTIEAPTTYNFPTFSFDRPTGKPPFVLTQRGRAVLNMPQGLNARPFEFKYAAQFRPTVVEQPVAVVGQRTLRIEGIDLCKAPLTGYEGVDRRLIEVRDQLRSQPFMNTEDLSAVLVVLTELAGLAARSLHDNLFPGVWREAAFQNRVRDELRRQPLIASQLEEHPHVGGGITDLSFRGIRVELKAETSPVTMGDCEQFADQTISYVVATGKRVGILCVLDSSPKHAPPFPAEEGIAVLIRRPKEYAIRIVTVLIQGNLARPSDLSR